MPRETHDINEPGYSFGKKAEEPKAAKLNTGIDESEPVEEKKEPEVRIISAEWKPGPKGFEYLEQCFVDVQTEFLPGKERTVRLRIRGELFGVYNEQEFDLSQEVVGYIDRKTGIARLEIKRLWFIDDHYPEWQKDPRAPCKYKIKGIFHSRGENQIDSPELEMPAPRPLLKRGHYDDVAVGNYSSRAVGGDGYIAGEWVEYVQQALTDFGFDEVGAVDGDFGRKTHDAVLLFQDCARNRQRLHEYAIEEVEPTFADERDGVVGDNTWGEIDLWRQKEYFRPTADLSITLAVDPADADVQDNEYLLIRATGSSEIADTDIVGYRTVRDDAVAGDQQLSLVISMG